MSLFDPIFHWWQRSRPWATQKQLSEVRNEHRMDNAALNAKLDGIAADLDEASTELQAEIKSLREQVENGGQTSGILAKIDAIAARAKALAGIIPGSPTPVPVPDPVPTDPAPTT